ncbi:MAG: penicillin-binding transpeptidase domain-containing protein [Verrucomicrobiota bacterium]
MLIFDQLKREDPKLRIISLGVISGLVILLAGLWWVQIVSAKRYEANLKNQSFRSVRVPALRGKILDRNNQSLAENRPRFDVNIYLEDLRPQFTREFASVARAFTNRTPGLKIRGKVLEEVNREARYRVASNITSQITSKLQQPQVLDSARFTKHYQQQPYIPFPLLQNLTQKQVAIFAENFTGLTGVEMEIQPMRTYPNGATASHLLGWIQRHDEPRDEEEIACKYYLPDFIGRAGVEASFDGALRGTAGVKSLLVNNLGYRQREEMLSLTEAGRNLSLTIDLTLQRAAEKALASAMPNVRGAAVVMDVRNGNILALVSAPAFDPNAFPNGISSADWSLLNNEKYSHMFNRATFGAYPPGSILKILTAIACFESNIMSPAEIIHDPGYFEDRRLLGTRRIKSLASPGDYDFKRAFLKSSNTYFIHFGLKAGLKKLVEVGERFHLGENTGILPGEEVSGEYPHSNRLSGKYAGDTANLCIGQGDITVTPIQVAAMTAAIANGGKLFWPRLIRDLRPADAVEADLNSFQSGSLRADVRLNPRHLQIIHQAMLADVEDSEGTGSAARVEGFRVGGKTGTAEGTKEQTTWFASFGPFENPRYAVVVMVQAGVSGGGTCAPVAGKIYKAILNLERTGPAAPQTRAGLN